jgi:hypothetical protein
MSGGAFDYKQQQINYIADEIEELVGADFRREDCDHAGMLTTYDRIECDTLDQRQAIVDEAKRLAVDLRAIYERVRSLDYLLSGDDGPETFLSRLKP